MKATKLTLAALMFAGSAGLALAQGGAGGEPTKGSDPNAPAAIKQQPGETNSAPVTQQTPPGMKQAPTGMQTTPSNAGPETGTAKDPAGPGATRKGGEKQ